LHTIHENIEIEDSSQSLNKSNSTSLKKSISSPTEKSQKISPHLKLIPIEKSGEYLTSQDYSADFDDISRSIKIN